MGLPNATARGPLSVVFGLLWDLRELPAACKWSLWKADLVMEQRLPAPATLAAAVELQSTSRLIAPKLVD